MTENKLESDNSVFNSIVNTINERIISEETFTSNDLEIINFFRDIVKAKTIKYFTTEKINKWLSLNIDSYIENRCTNIDRRSDAMFINIIKNKASLLKNNMRCMSQYLEQSNEGYF